MLYCGLRPGEATGLTWDRVDLDEATLRIRQSRKMAPDGVMALGPKADRTGVSASRRQWWLCCGHTRSARRPNGSPHWSGSTPTSSSLTPLGTTSTRRTFAADRWPVRRRGDLPDHLAGRTTPLSGLATSSAVPPPAQIADFLGHRDPDARQALRTHDRSCCGRDRHASKDAAAASRML